MTKPARAFFFALLISGVALAETSPNSPALLLPSGKPYALAAYPRPLPGSLFKIYLVPFPWSCGGAFVMNYHPVACFNYPFLQYHADVP